MAATKEEHLEKVEENLAFLGSIDETAPGAFSWSVTVLFYTALHYIEAYFASHGRGFKHHFSRGNAIQQDPRIKALYPTYRTLEDLSREARYDVSTLNKGDVAFARRNFDDVRKAILAIL